jgi:hypothetical protein
MVSGTGTPEYRSRSARCLAHAPTTRGRAELRASATPRRDFNHHTPEVVIPPGAEVCENAVRPGGHVPGKYALTVLLATTLVGGAIAACGARLPRSDVISTPDAGDSGASTAPGSIDAALVLSATLPEGTTATRVVAVVSPAGTEQDLVAGAGGAYVTTLRLPPGAQTVTVTALAGTAAVASREAPVTLTAGETSAMALTLIATVPLPDAGVPPHGGSSTPPVVSSVTISKTSARVGEAVAVTAVATDPLGAPLSYRWTSTCSSGAGSFADAAQPTTTWSATAPATCSITVTATARGLASSALGTVIVVSGGTGAVQTWGTHVPGTGVQGMAGGVSNGALGDRSPAGRPDTLVFATAEYGGSGNIYLHHGTIGGGPTTRLTVSSTATAGTPGMLDVTAVQDTVSFDVHILASTNADQRLHYWRYRPTRDSNPGAAQGTITGWTRVVHLTLPAGFVAVAPSMIEAVDGRGVHRLVVVAQKGAVNAPPTSIVAFTTKPAAGVAPSSAADFVGLQGEATPTAIVTHAGSDSWSTTLGVEQHVTSRTLECFAMSGLHGVQGEHSRTRLRVSSLDPSWWELGTTEWYSRSGTAWRGTAGGFAAAASDDSVWWTWSGAGPSGAGLVQHFSRVDGAGAVTHDVIPSPGNPSTSAGAGQFPFMNHIALSSTGLVASLVTTTDGPGEVRLRVWDGVRWSETLVASYVYYDIQGCGFRGTTVVDGSEWMALFVAQGTGESLVAAASFPR